MTHRRIYFYTGKRQAKRGGLPTFKEWCLRRQVAPNKRNGRLIQEYLVEIGNMQGLDPTVWA